MRRSICAIAIICLCACDAEPRGDGLAAAFSLTELAGTTVIGADTGSAPLAGMSDVATDSLGRVYILDGASGTVHVYDPAGAHRFAFGQSGDGPAQLRNPCCVAFAPDGRLWIRDNGNARYSIWRIDGDSAIGADTQRMVHTDASRVAPVIFEPNGRVIDVGARAIEGGGVRTHHFHLDSTGAIARVQMMPSPPADSTGMRAFTSETPDGRSIRLFTIPPFGPGELRAHGPGGEYAHGISSRYVIDWRATDGTLLRTIRGDVSDGPALSEREAQRADSLIARLAEQVGVAREQLRMSVPATKQPLHLIYFDADGRLWVELATADGSRRHAHVYNRMGERVLNVTWPTDVDLTQGDMKGETFWGIAGSGADASVVRLEPVGASQP